MTKTYISILRGINVSGQKPIKMDKLKALYEAKGYTNVKTYIQSGNVVFDANTENPRQLESGLSQKIKEVFGHDVPVIVLSNLELRSIADNNPYVKDQDKNPDFFHVTFLSDEPSNQDISQLIAKKQNDEAIRLIGKAIYLYCPNGYGRTKLNNNFIENKLKISATTRNWKSVNKLLQMANE